MKNHLKFLYLKVLCRWAVRKFKGDFNIHSRLTRSKNEIPYLRLTFSPKRGWRCGNERAHLQFDLYPEEIKVMAWREIFERRQIECPGGEIRLADKVSEVFGQENFKGIKGALNYGCKTIIDYCRETMNISFVPVGHHRCRCFPLPKGGQNEKA